MKNLRKYQCVAALLVSGLVASCSSDDDDDDPSITDADIDTTISDFAFTTTPVADFTRIDRIGMPAISTALIASKDSYNDADPSDDIAGAFVPEIIASLTALHSALDDDLAGVGIEPCTVVGDGSGTCVTVAGPLIIPDTLKIDTAADAGFPNGRLLTDPIIDVTLAVALIELTGSAEGQTPTSLVGVLNPTANDNEFSAEFPFLAAPNN